MPDPGTDRRDFFISFNSVDRDWAEWIASELEAAGYTTYFQYWDFAPGSNFVLEMQKAASQSDRTIAVLSPAYLAALFTQPEWAAALVQDPTSSNRKLVPLRVQECRPSGILAPIVYADLVGLDEEAARMKLKMAAEGDQRQKPGCVPFPKPEKGAARKRVFPGVVDSSPSAASPSSPPGPLPKAPEKPVLPETPPSPEFSLVWFVLALMVAGLLIGFAGRLAAFGLTNQIYFLVLIAVGLAAAVSLFRNRHSRATYTSDGHWGVLKLGGPPVVFASVILMGMWFAPGLRSFGLTVFVEGPEGPLRNGSVALDLGPDRRVEFIGEKGAAFFVGIPAEFRGRDVAVSLNAEGFERTESGPVNLAGDIVYVKVHKRAIRLHGIVLDDRAERISNGSVEIGGLSKPIINGHFDFLVPGDLVKNETVTVDIRAPGYVSQTHQLVPGSQEFRTKMLRSATR